MSKNPCAAVNDFEMYGLNPIEPAMQPLKPVAMECYYDLLRKILREGHHTADRTGTGTIASFGHQLKFDLNDGFPLITGKFTSFKMIAAELLWFLSGSTDNNVLKEFNGNGDKDTIWSEWADKDGDLGPIYGAQWRNWSGSFGNTVDQISNLLDGLRDRPFSRRHILSAWNVADLPKENLSPQENVRAGDMSLAPCHLLSQFGVRKLTLKERESYLPHGLVENGITNEDKMINLDKLGIEKYALSCHMILRSSDTFLGLPYNIASYALLTHILANITNMTVGTLTVSIGDAHIYSNHIKQVKELLSRVDNHYAGVEGIPPLPTLCILENLDIDNLEMKSFKVVGYKPLSAIKASVSV